MKHTDTDTPRTRKFAAMVMGSLVALGVTLPTVATAGAEPAVSNEHLLFVIKLPQAGPNFTGRVVATGVVNGAGTLTAGGGSSFPVTVSLPQGELSAFAQTTSDNSRPDPRTCIVSVEQTDAATITGGSGVFANATGSWTDVVRGTLVFSRNLDRTCNFDAGPVTGVLQVVVAAHLTLA